MATQAHARLSIKQKITQSIKNICPSDDIEKVHIANTLAWINSTDAIFRTQKPDIPNKHLVSYFAVYDENCKSILLVDHKKSGLWLPTGGHVEPDEHPADTVTRECYEELNVKAKLLTPNPIFLTETETVGSTAGHIDVSLWFLVEGNVSHNYEYDRDEFHFTKWFKLDEIPFNNSDPHMKRFVTKLKQQLL